MPTARLHRTSFGGNWESGSRLRRHRLRPIVRNNEQKSGCGPDRPDGSRGCRLQPTSPTGPSVEEASSHCHCIVAALSIQCETITVPVNSVDVAWIVRIRFYLPPQASNQIIDTACERNVLVAPDFPEGFIPGYDLAGARAHVAQHLDFALAERDLLVVAFGRIVIEVDVQGT